jgi:hypothetical protein
MKVLVLMLKSVNYKMSRSQSFRGSLSLMIPITTFCVANMVAERQAQILLAKPNLSLEKSLNLKILFIMIKLKVWNMNNVSMWYQKKPIPQLSIFCLIQGINNYVQINTYWNYIVQITFFCWRVKLFSLLARDLWVLVWIVEPCT